MGTKRPAHFRKPDKTGPQSAPEVLRVRVAFADTDAMGVVWHGGYLRWFEMARTEHAFSVAAGRVMRSPRDVREIFTALGAAHGG